MQHRRALVAALLLWCSATGATSSAAPAALVVRGACRDGQPNGAYELRDRDGQLRALGAFHAGKPTGTFIFWNDAGGRLAAIPYDDGVRNGTIATWHIGGKPPRERGRKLELPVVRGEAQGVMRAWHPNGQLHAEAEFVHGRPVRVVAWDAAGRELVPAQASRAVRDELMGSETNLARLERLVSGHLPVCE